MKVGPIPLFLVLFTIFSCSDQETQQKLVDTQRKLVATEQKLLQAIHTNQSNAELIKMYVETVQNVIHSSNDKYTIRIDQTQDWIQERAGSGDYCNNHQANATPNNKDSHYVQHASLL